MTNSSGRRRTRRFCALRLHDDFCQHGNGAKRVLSGRDYFARRQIKTIAAIVAEFQRENVTDVCRALHPVHWRPCQRCPELFGTQETPFLRIRGQDNFTQNVSIWESNVLYSFVLIQRVTINRPKILMTIKRWRSKTHGFQNVVKWVIHQFWCRNGRGIQWSSQGNSKDTISHREFNLKIGYGKW